MSDGIDEVRESRIEMLAVVDCYDEVERAMGWYYYLEARLDFPFKAKCINSDRHSEIEVAVIEMASENDCESDMYVEIEYQEGIKDIFTARLADIQPLNASIETSEAISDWHYWLARKYEF